jgi:hypothetical protein
MLEQIRGEHRVTVGADKGYDTRDFVAEEAQANRRELRLAEDDRTDAQGAASGDSQGRLGVYVRGRCVQSGAAAESAVTSGSSRVSRGRRAPKIAKW